MAITKLPKNAFADNSVDASKIEDGTIQAVEISGTVSASKLSSTTDLSTKTVTLPNTSVTNDMLAGSIANAKLSNSAIIVRGTSRSLGSSFSIGVDVDWQSKVTSDGSTVTTMVAGQGYFIDNTSAAGLVKLPTSASTGDTIAIKDYAGNFGTNSLTIQRNGHKIQGVANESEITTNRASLVLVYVDSTKGWLYTDEHNVADLQLNQFTEATGGTITTSGNFKIHTFTGDGCFVVSQVGVGPSGGPSNVDYLVVAGGGGGGGGGGAFGGGGGGAGGHRTTFPSPGCNAGAFPISAQTYPITVGAGGASNTSSPKHGVNGSNSVFSTITSAGGGGGGSAPGPACGTRPCGAFNRSGGSGGSGGGQGGVLYCSPTGNCAPNYNRGSGNTPPVTPPQGNPGGFTSGSSFPVAPAGTSGKGGGGGGAGASGSNGGGTAPGGNGTANSITASPVTRAGGGGNGGSDWPGFPSAAGAGGSGGGGDGGGQAGDCSQAGTANTGGGGGAGGWAGPQQAAPTPETYGSAGGKGIVIIRYKYQ